MITDTLMPDPRSALEMVIAVSLLIGLVLFARKPVARQFGAGIAYALWLVPLARLVLPPLPTPMSWVSLLGLAPAAALPHLANGPATHLPPTFTPSGALVPQASGAGHASGLTVEFTPAMSDSALGGMGLADLFLPGLFAVWFAGTAVALLRNLLTQHSFMAVVDREKVPASARLQALAEDVAHQVGLKGKLRIATSLISTGPLVTGLFRPIVLMPAWFEEDYDESQQRAALAHELMHIKRGDLWALQMAELFVACLWFNPLAYFARRAFRTDQEAACDSDVLRTGAASPHAYGSTLLKAVRLSFPERLPLAASLPLTHSLKERLRLMAYPTPSRRRRFAGLGLTALLGSAALITTASVTATAGEPAEGSTSSITVDNSTLYIDGEKVDDRQFVLLGEPFGPRDVPGEDEIRQLSHRIDVEVSKITVPPPMPPLPPMPDMPPMPDVPDVPPVPPVQSMDLRSGKRMIIFRGQDDQADEEARARSEAEWDAWAQEFESRTAEWQERVDAHVAEWEQKYDAETDAANHEIEARIDIWADELETRIEAVYGADYAERFDDISVPLDALATGCRDAGLAPGETRILSYTDDDGKTLHVACIQGDESRLRAPETLAAIQSSELLGDSEKQSFTGSLDQKRTIEITK